MTDRTCHECGAVMVRDTRHQTFEYKGQTIMIDQPGLYCTSCNESLLMPEDMAATDPLFEAFRDHIDGILPPAEIKRIRKKLELRQKQAGVVLGGGASAFHKYESGVGKPSLAISNLLRLLDHDPSRLREITGHQADEARGP